MQTGLIKVDDKVYYMNADGSLFSGNMKIGTVEYNFTDYGTTNGKPSVGASQTFGGNGNQTNVIPGGGGYSRSGGGNGGTVTDTVKDDVQKAVKLLADSEKDNAFVSTSIDGQKIKIAAKSDQTTLSEVLDKAEEVLLEILDTDGVKAVVFEGTSINTRDDIKTVASDKGLAYDTLLGDVEKSYEVKVVLSNGQSIDYTISVNK